MSAQKQIKPVEQECWTCGDTDVKHKTYRDALGEYELTCNKCHRIEYPEEYEEEEPTITYETFASQYDNDKVMLFKYDGEKYDYSDELYFSKDKGNFKYEWINLVIKEYKLEYGDRWCFDYKHQTDDAFMLWRKHSKRPIIHCDFKICSRGHLWKQKIDIENLKTEMIKVKSDLFGEEEEVKKLCKNTDCVAEENDEYDESCNICDGYYKDDGLNDILFIQEEPNNEDAICNLCGKTDDIVQMKDTGEYICQNACDEEEDDSEE